MKKNLLFLALAAHFIATSPAQKVEVINSTTGVKQAVTMSGGATISTAGVVSIGGVSLTSGVTGILPSANGGFAANIAASSGVPLFSSGVATFTGTTGTGTFVRADGGTITSLNVSTGLNLINAAPLTLYGSVSGTVTYYAKATVGGTYSIYLGATGNRNITWPVADGTIVAIVGAGRVTAQTAAAASVAAYTTPAADGSYEVSANVLVTTATLHSFTATVTYTDEGSTSRTVTMQFSTLAGAFVTAMTNAQGAVPYEGVPLHIRVKASTAITIATTGTFTTVTYNAEGVIKQTQ